MRGQGTTTVEIKSGYGLTVHDEARSLAVARQFTDETTFLGAHVVPADSRPRRTYVDLVTGPMLDAAAPHARWIDVFCERGAFDVDQARAILAAGADDGLRGRLHANQLGPGPGVQLAAELGLVAVDHCTYLADDDVDALADSGTIATLLPGRRVLDPAALPRRPPADRRRRAGRARQRLQPGLLLHLLDAALHRAGRPRDADDPGRGASTPRPAGAAGARPRRRRRDRRRAGARTWCCSTRRPTSTSPTAPASRSSPRLAGRPPRLTGPV